MPEDVRRLIAMSLDLLDEAHRNTETLPDVSDICMASMYLNHCMKRLEEANRD